MLHTPFDLYDCEEFPQLERGTSYVSPGRLDSLFQHLVNRKLLLLHGPSNSGKKNMGIHILTKLFEQTRYARLRVRLCGQGSGFASDPDLDPQELKDQNENRQRIPVVYAFLDCASELDSIWGLFRPYLEPPHFRPYDSALENLRVLLTLSHDIDREPPHALFRSAKERGLTVELRADEAMVREILQKAGRQMEGLSEHFGQAFACEEATADLGRVNEFLRFAGTIEQFAELRALPALAEPQEEEVLSLLKCELAYLNVVCMGVAERGLDRFFVKRSFRPCDRGDQASAPEAPRDESGTRQSWSKVVPEQGAVFLLGEAGLGKTIQLLHEVRQRCLQYLQEPKAEVRPAFYLTASALAERLAQREQDVVKAVVDLVSQRHGQLSGALRHWITAQLETGGILLALDALDELPVEQPDCREILYTRLAAYLRANPSAVVLLSSRRTAYRLAPGLDAQAWLLLPFDPQQLYQAGQTWFSDEPAWAQEFRRGYDMPPLRELLQVPILFMLAARAWEYALRAGQRPITFARRCDFFDSCVARFRQRWVERMEVQGCRPTELQENEFIPFVQELAWRLWQRDPGRTHFPASEISQVIEETPTPPRLAERTDLFADLRESGIIRLEKEAADRIWVFLHRTVLEFLAASHLARRANASAQSLNHVFSTMRPYFGDEHASVLLWMLAGKLNEPMAFVQEIVGWAKEQIHTVSWRSPVESPRFAELLADCLFECSRGTLPQEARADAWSVITIGLERNQRLLPRKHRGESLPEWTMLADWSLVYRTLSAVERHEGGMVGADKVLGLLGDIRAAGVRAMRGGLIRTESIPEGLTRLKDSLGSLCPVVRWAAVWAAGALARRGRAEIARAVQGQLENLLAHDSDSAVRSIAARALVQVGHPRLEELLVDCLKGTNGRAAAGAAVALSHLMTPGAIKQLEAAAGPSLESTDPGDLVPAAVTGALEAIVDRARTSEEPSVRRLLQDDLLAGIFMRGLKHPNPFVRRSAASGLGKMRRVEAASSLRAVLEAPAEDGRMERSFRASACFAHQQLIPALGDNELSPNLELFRRLLCDGQEAPAVRCAAASGLGDLARRGCYDLPGIQALLQGVQDLDLTVAKSCLFALTRFEAGPVQDVKLMLSKLERVHDLAAAVAASNPTRTGLEIVMWLLDNPRRPSTWTAALVALQTICKKACDPTRPTPKYAHDATLLRHIADRCLALIHSKRYDVVTSAVSALGELSKLPPFRTGGPLFSLRLDIVGQARVLLEHPASDVQIASCYVLRGLGAREDAERLSELERQCHSEKVQRFAHDARQHLLSRYAT